RIWCRNILKDAMIRSTYTLQLQKHKVYFDFLSAYINDFSVFLPAYFELFKCLTSEFVKIFFEVTVPLSSVVSFSSPNVNRVRGRGKLTTGCVLRTRAIE
ncbi:hypothetical protein L9F63_007789, partial [Diploptera punctata]